MSAPRRPSRALLALVVGAVLALGAVVGAAEPVVAQVGPGVGVRPRYRPPVVAEVTDPFRAPPERWAAGNRGIEYGTVPGQEVRAIGPGIVTFAGPVAGALHVTIRHPDGLRSSYSFVAAIRVGAGDIVEAGQVVAIAAARLHLGVRRGEAYLDPASLWGSSVGGGRAHLVPDPDPEAGADHPVRAGPGAYGQVVGAIARSVRPW